MTSAPTLVHMKIIVALAVIAASVVLPAAPAQAVVAPERVPADSAFDTVNYKYAEAECPEGQVVFGMGGKINNGGGRVAMTSIMTGPLLRSVVVWGHALPDTTVPWSVTAVAICHAPGDRAPERVTSTAPGQFVAGAECTGGKVLYSIGYRILEPDGDEFIRAAVPSADLLHVMVQADGPGVDPNNLVALGVCAFPQPRWERTQSPPTAFDPSSPKEAVAGQPETVNQDWGRWMVGAGAQVIGAQGVLIDAMLPTPNLKNAYGRAQKASPTIGFAGVAAGEDDWGLVVYGEYEGEWC
jgi:hypothetical protein